MLLGLKTTGKDRLHEARSGVFNFILTLYFSPSTAWAGLCLMDSVDSNQVAPLVHRANHTTSVGFCAPQIRHSGVAGNSGKTASCGKAVHWIISVRESSSLCCRVSRRSQKSIEMVGDVSGKALIYLRTGTGNHQSRLLRASSRKYRATLNFHSLRSAIFVPPSRCAKLMSAIKGGISLWNPEGTSTSHHHENIAKKCRSPQGAQRSPSPLGSVSQNPDGGDALSFQTVATNEDCSTIFSVLGLAEQSLV